MTISKNSNRTIALAGISQAAFLVQSLARTGEVDEDAYYHSLGSLLITEPEQPMDVFGELKNLKIGLQVIVGQLNMQGKHKDPELTRYIFSVIGLQKKLVRRETSLNELSQRISNIKRQQEHFELTDPQVIKNIASMYTDIISPLGPRIQIAGVPKYLKVEANQHKIRALLLAGVRAAVLWNQLGGKRRHIIFRRERILNSAQEALNQI